MIIYTHSRSIPGQDIRCSIVRFRLESRQPRSQFKRPVVKSWRTRVRRDLDPRSEPSGSTNACADDRRSRPCEKCDKRARTPTGSLAWTFSGITPSRSTSTAASSVLRSKSRHERHVRHSVAGRWPLSHRAHSMWRSTDRAVSGGHWLRFVRQRHRHHLDVPRNDEGRRGTHRRIGLCATLSGFSTADVIQTKGLKLGNVVVPRRIFSITGTCNSIGLGFPYRDSFVTFDFPNKPHEYLCPTCYSTRPIFAI